MTAVAKYLVLPSSWIVLSALVGSVLMCARATRQWGGRLTAGALCLYLFFGTGPVAFWLLGRLEYQIAPSSFEEIQGIHTLVVLAAYAEPDPGIPLSSKVNSAAASRLLEVLSQANRDPNLTIIVSGTGGVPETMRDVLVSAGFQYARISIDGNSGNTYESARNLSPMLGKTPFLLVTSAGHMPRAVGVFRKAGGQPYPVPTHYMTKRNWLAISYLPKPSHLEYSDLAVTEFIALLWYSANGWL